tara:strand:- start:280 stop:411 length:132 start_codon:yes stop_codon:yes gene_type:complete
MNQNAYDALYFLLRIIGELNMKYNKVGTIATKEVIAIFKACDI